MEDLPKPVFLSAPKAAMLCGVTRNTVCAWIRDGKLSSYRTAGGKHLIRPGDLIAFMRECNMFVPDALVDLARKDQEQTSGQDDRVTTVEPSILIVDDDADSRVLAGISLKKLGMPIVEAESGYEALHRLLKNPAVALIILDIVMPGQQGTETLAEIRSQNMTMPVIVVTGHSTEHLESRFGDIKPDKIITKPYNPSQLLEAAQELLADT